MNTQDKRLALKIFCEGRSCNNCPLDAEDCLFEKGSDDQIDRYYDIVFNQPKDMVNSPSHYELPGDMEVIDVEIATQGVEAVKEHCVCAAIEYLLRHKKKNGAEDVKKAHWWLSKYVELTEKETE